MPTPYVGFSNDTLAAQPVVKRGDMITCTKCRGKHELTGSEADDGTVDLLLFYKCGDTTFLGAVDSRSVVGRKPDASGEA